MAYNLELADRIREVLAGQAEVREVGMFGGLAFLVDEKMAVSANRGGGLMVRVDPARVEDLLAKGAQEAQMSRGRRMSKGWLVVDPETVLDDDDLEFWVGVALDYNRTVTGKRRR